MSGIEYPVVIGLLAALVGGSARSVVWFTVGVGLVVGVTMQIAAAIVAGYLVITTIPSALPIRHHRTGGVPRDPRGHHTRRPATV